MEDKTHPSDLWSGALIAVGLLILQGFFSSNSINTSALVSVIAFAIAIPILSCNLLTNFLRRRVSNKPSDQVWKISGYEITFYGLGIGIALFGIGAAFWHISWVSALIFAFSALLAFIVFTIVRKSI